MQNICIENICLTNKWTKFFPSQRVFIVTKPAHHLKNELYIKFIKKLIVYLYFCRLLIAGVIYFINYFTHSSLLIAEMWLIYVNWLKH